MFNTKAQDLFSVKHIDRAIGQYDDRGYPFVIYHNQPKNIYFVGLDTSGRMFVYKGFMQDGPINCVGIVKKQPGSCFAGRGNQQYVPPSYMIGLVTELKLGAHGVYQQGYFKIEWEIEYSKKYQKQAKVKALELYQSLLEGYDEHRI